MKTKATLTLLVLLIACPLHFLGQDSLTYAQRRGMELMADTTHRVDIHLYGITTDRTDPDEEKLLPGVTITMRDLYGETAQITSDDSAFYNLELKFDNKYLIYFEYENMYTKYIEVDTRDVIDIEQERGYMLPTDMSMQPSENYKIAALYLRKPIGRLYFERRLQMMSWDMDYTDKLKQDIRKLEAKKDKR